MKTKFLLLAASCALMAIPAVAQDTGYIKTKVNPGRAGVFVDGKYMGPAANFRMARKYAVAPGEHEVKLVDPRYEPVTTKVTVSAGKTTTVSEKLKAKSPATGPFGRIRTVHADKFAAVYINDHFYGHVDEFSNFAQGIMLPAGEYTVKIEPKSGSPVTQTVKLVVDQTVIVQ